MRKFLLILFVIAGVTGSAQNFWTKKASFGGLKRERGISFSIGNFGYFGMGEDTASIVHNDLWVYDPVLDVWAQVASLPGVARRNAVSFSIDTLGYVGTGIDASESMLGNLLKDFWEYNPNTNLWTAKANYPGAYGSGVYFATGFAVDSKGYICAGKIGPSSYVNDLWEYKPSADTWLQRADFPGGVRYQHSSLVIGLLAYVGLGTDENVNKNDWWEYNPGTNGWTQMNDFPGSERANASTFTLGSRGYVLLGSNGGFLDDLWEYNQYTDTWVVRSGFPGTPRRNAGSFAINNKGYAGMGKGGGGIKQNFYEYTPILVIGIDENESEIALTSCFPNPATDKINVEYAGKHKVAAYSITNVAGQKIAGGFVSTAQFSVNCSSIESGYYLLNLLDEKNNLIDSKKISIQ